MSQFNTREEVVSAFRTKNPQFTNIDDNKVYNYVEAINLSTLLKAVKSNINLNLFLP